MFEVVAWVLLVINMWTHESRTIEIARYDGPGAETRCKQAVQWINEPVGEEDVDGFELRAKCVRVK